MSSLTKDVFLNASHSQTCCTRRPTHIILICIALPSICIARQDGQEEVPKAIETPLEGGAIETVGAYRSVSHQGKWVDLMIHPFTPS